MCLPPVGHTHHSPHHIEERTTISEALSFNESIAAVGEQSKSAKSTRSRKLLDSAECLSRLSHTLASVKENSSVNSIKEPLSDAKDSESLQDIPTPVIDKNDVSKPEENISKTETDKQTDKPLAEDVPLPPSCSSKKESTSESVKETAKSSASSKAKQLLKNDLTIENIKEVLGRPNTSSRDIMLESLQETLGRPPTTTSRYKGLERRKEFTLESLSSSEARAMSGLLRQASLEKIGSSRIGNFTGSKSRLGNYSIGPSVQDGRITTPEGRLVVSCCLQCFLFSFSALTNVHVTFFFISMVI